MKRVVVVAASLIPSDLLGYPLNLNLALHITTYVRRYVDTYYLCRPRGVRREGVVGASENVEQLETTAFICRRRAHGPIGQLRKFFLLARST